MACDKQCKADVFAAFFDEGEYSALFAQGALEAAFGCAGGQPVYAVFQNGGAVCAKDLERNVKVLDMAAKTGNPVVTFYNSIGGKLEEGMALLKANAALSAKISAVSGVVPQIAVVLGVCGGTAAMQAAAADICIMSEEGELFLTAPFTSAAAGDTVEGAGSAAMAAKAGVVALVEKDAEAAAAKAAEIVGMLPSNNLTSPALFEFAEPAAWPAKYEAAAAAAALADGESLVELNAGYGKNVYTALGTVNGAVVGFVATQPQGLCKVSTSKAARFVRLCDAFSIPVVTVVNSEGFDASVSSDVAGGIREAARLAGTYGDATTACVAVLAGKAVGPVYSALACADLTIAMKGSVASLVDPKTAAAVLYKEELEEAANMQAATDKKAAEYAAQQAGPEAALAEGCADFTADGGNVRAVLAAALDMLVTKRAQRMPKKHGNMAL